MLLLQNYASKSVDFDLALTATEDKKFKTKEKRCLSRLLAVKLGVEE